jgi:SAM-dependent methyltransferase
VLCLLLADVSYRRPLVSLSATFQFNVCSVSWRVRSFCAAAILPAFLEKTAVEQNWHSSFFTGIALEFWWRVTTPEWTESDVSFLSSALGLQPGSRVLDVPCGNGRHSIALARQGVRVTGLDLAEENIAEARRLGAGLDVDWRVGDMRDLPFDSEFDGAFCFGNSFGYLDRQGTGDFVRAAARALKPSARFVVDTGVAAESILTSPLQRRWFAVDDMYMLSEQRYDPALSRLQTDYTFVRNGHSETRGVWYWILTTAEIRRMFEDAGFEIETMYGDLNRTPYALGSPRLLLVARRL